MEQNKNEQTPCSKENDFMKRSLLAAFSPQNFSRDQLAKIIGEAMLKTMDSNDLDITTSTPTQVANEIKNNTISPIQDEISTVKLMDLPNKQEQQPFKIPSNEIISHLESIQKLCLIIGNKSTDLQTWYSNISSLFNSFENQLKIDKEVMNESFVKSLESISIISSITSNFTNSPKQDNDIHISQILNESSDTSVTLKLQQLIIDYKSQSFTKLEDYCSDNSTMSQLSNTIEKTIIKLIPVLNTKLNDFTNKLNQYYSKLGLMSDSFETELVDFKINENFTHMIPSFELVQMNIKNSSSMDINDIKLTLQSEYRNLTPELLKQIDTEILRLNEVILKRCQLIKSLQFKILKLNHLLYENGEMGFMESISSNFKDNDTILKNVGINMKIINKYESQLEKLEQLRHEREMRQTDLKSNIIEIWTMLNQSNSKVKEIEIKLRPMMKLHDSCLNQMSSMLDSLEIEKRQNIGKFINSTRSKIEECWDKLMYDETSRCQFIDYYIQDDTLLTEECLKIHNEYLLKLQNELNELEPLLENVEKLNNILDMKVELEQAQKNPSRLLKQNSFKVLRREELVRKRIDSELPNTVSELKVSVSQWESNSNRRFIVEGKEYLIRLKEIEESLPKRRSFIKPFSSTSSAQSSARKPVSLTGRRATSHSATSNIHGLKTPTPSVRSASLNSSQQSVIKRRNISDFTDPFKSSKRPSPKRQKIDTNRNRTPLLSISDASKKINTPVISPSRIQSPMRRSRIPMKSDGIGQLDIMTKLRSPDIYKSKSSPIRKEVAVELLSDLEIENEDVLIDKENVKPFAEPMKMKFNPNEMFNLSAIDSETF